MKIVSQVTISLLNLLCLHCVGSGAQRSTDCEKTLGSAFSAKEKLTLCGSVSVPERAKRTATCAAEVKRDFKMKFEDIVAICQDATSLSHLECIRGLSPADRLTVGKTLCSRGTSAAHAQCFKVISSMKQRGSKDGLDGIINFCSQSQPDIGVGCVDRISNMFKFPLTTSFEICKGPVADSETFKQCTDKLKPLVNVVTFKGKKLTAENMTRACIQSATVQDVMCLHSALITHSKTSTLLQSFIINDYISVCKGSSTESGPISCLKSQVEALHTKPAALQGSYGLCFAAVDTAPVGCFLSLYGTPTPDVIKTRLCQGALSNGPADCFKQIKQGGGASQGISDDAVIELCNRSPSAAPASCVASAAKHLSNKEKVLLCRGIPDSIQWASPTECLRAIEQSVGKLPAATSEHDDRSELLSMCSFTLTRSPLSAAACVRQLVSKMTVRELASTCRSETREPSSVDFSHAYTCLKLLNGDSKQVAWTFAEAALLCDNAQENPTTQKEIVTCALEAKNVLKFNHSQAINLCKLNSDVSHLSNGASLKFACATSAFALSNSLGLPKPNFDTTVYICSMALQSAASLQSELKSRGVLSKVSWSPKASLLTTGSCLAQASSRNINGMTHMQLEWDSDVLEQLCASVYPLSSNAELTSVLSCILASKKNLITEDIFRSCIAEPRKLESAELISLETESGTPVIHAATSFVLSFRFLDQYRNALNDISGVFIQISIEDKNPQSAVLWGPRIAEIKNGTAILPGLSISQPGPINLFLSAKTDQILGRHQYMSYDREETPSVVYSIHGRRRITSIRISVEEDPQKPSSGPCLFVFKEAMCPYSLTERDAEVLHPLHRSRLPTQRYLELFSCASVLENWNVAVFPEKHSNLIDGFSIEYRTGIDAIWTSVSLPTIEWSHLELLGINTMSPSQKEVRRAYYKKSLLWHPDRWAGMPIYLPVVQNIFEIVSEAYRALSSTEGVDSGTVSTSQS